MFSLLRLGPRDHKFQIAGGASRPEAVLWFWSLAPIESDVIEIACENHRTGTPGSESRSLLIRRNRLRSLSVALHTASPLQRDDTASKNHSRQCALYTIRCRKPRKTGCRRIQFRSSVVDSHDNSRRFHLAFIEGSDSLLDALKLVRQLYASGERKLPAGLTTTFLAPAWRMLT